MRQGRYIYDIILYGLITLLVFGLIGNGAQPVRLFTLALSPFMIIDAIKRPHPSLHYYRFECFFLLFWLLWAISFLYKAEDMEESVKHTIYLFIHILGFLEVLWAANKAKDPQQAIKYGWLSVILFSIPIAVYEFLTDFHLPMSIQDTGTTMVFSGIHVDRPFASVTFGNLNSYNTVLCWALPSLFMLNLYPRSKWEQTMGLVLMGMAALIIVANASRGAILCLILMLGTYIYSYYRMGRNRTLLTIILVTGIGLFVFYLGELFIMILERFSDQGVSDDGRVENLEKGFQAFLDSYGLGIGIGNYGPIMGNVYRVLYAAPHNLFLEVLVCFGLLNAIGFVGMFIHVIRTSLKTGISFNRDMLLFCTAAIIFAGIIDSNYIMKATTWMFIATTYVYTDPRYNHSKDILTP